MQIVVLAAAAIALALVAGGLVVGGSRLYARDGAIAYAGLPAILAGIAIAYAATYAGIGAAIHALS